jgi:hypothetical protein
VSRLQQRPDDDEADEHEQAKGEEEGAEIHEGRRMKERYVWRRRIGFQAGDFGLTTSD